MDLCLLPLKLVGCDVAVTNSMWQGGPAWKRGVSSRPPRSTVNGLSGLTSARPPLDRVCSSSPAVVLLAPPLHALPTLKGHLGCVLAPAWCRVLCGGPWRAAAAAGHPTDRGLRLDPSVCSVWRAEHGNHRPGALSRSGLSLWGQATALPGDRLWVLGLGSEWPIVQKEGQWPLCSPLSRIPTLPQRSKMRCQQVPQSRVAFQPGAGTLLVTTVDGHGCRGRA